MSQRILIHQERKLKELEESIRTEDMRDDDMKTQYFFLHITSTETRSTLRQAHSNDRRIIYNLFM